MKLDQTCFRDIEFAYNAMKKWEPEAFIINDKAYMYGSKACGTNTTAIVTLNDTSDRIIYIDDIPRFLKAASHITSEKILVKFSPELERLFFCNCDTDEEQSFICISSRMPNEEMVGVESKTTDGLSPVTDDTPILIDFPYLRKIKKIIDITYMAGVFKIEKDTLFYSDNASFVITEHHPIGFNGYMNKDLLELLLAIKADVRIVVKEESGQVAYTIKMTEANITFLYQCADFKKLIELPEDSEIADILPLDDYKFVAEIDNITLQSAIKQFNLWPEHIWRWGQVFFEFHPDHIRLHYDDGNIGKSLTIPVSVIQDDIKHVFEAYIATAFFKWFSHYNGKIIITINDIDSRTKHGIAMIIRYGTCEMVLCKMTSP